MPTSLQQRSELRLRGAFTVLIETYSAAPGDQHAPKVSLCNTLDVSANGLMLNLDEALPVEGIFQLCLESHEPPYRFHLVGEVRWVRPAPEGGHMTGFTLFDSDGSDIAQWKRMVANRLEQSDGET